MKNRILSLFLAFVMFLGILPAGLLPALAASTEDEALGEVDIFNGGHEMAYLSINGSVRTQKYTYYNFTTAGGYVRETPAYCVNPNLYGVPQTVGPGESIKYLANEKASDPKVVGIICNGYPHYSLEALGLDDKYQAYYATKMALWCYLMPAWDINSLKVAPGLSAADQEIADRVLHAVKTIYQRGTTYNYMLEPKLTVSPDKPAAYPVTVDGRQYKQQVFTLRSETFVYGLKVGVAFSDPGSVPAGTRIVDMDDQDITDVITDGSVGSFKVLYPADSVKGETGSVQLSLTASVAKYAVMYAICAEKDKYGNLQNYICDVDNNQRMELAAVSNYYDAPEAVMPEDETALKIVKLEEGTELPLEGAVFSVHDPFGRKLGSWSTGSDGTVTIPLTLEGHYTVTEEIPPQYHLLPNITTQHADVEYNKTAVLTFWNAPYGSLRVQKLSNTGAPLNGVTVQIKHIESGEVFTGKTQMGGVAVFDHLKPGGYEVKEAAGISGWIADTDTVQTVSVAAGQSSDVTIINKELPGLRIIKYDRKNMVLLSKVTFAIYRDGEFLGNFQTDEFGEILLTDARPGTYRAFEVDTGNEGTILDTTPQEVELHPGDGIKELLFFNDAKPGMRLVKVDSSDPSKVIPNAVFEIRSVKGDYGPEEYTTGQNGEIDLSHLPVGAYVVTEKSCAGYVVDDAQRIIHLDPNEDAVFVFTNSKLPSLHLIKTSSDGSPLAGVSFRLAKIEDGSHYLDRTTDSKGEILWEGLEPGVYSLKELNTTDSHILDAQEHHVELFPGKTSTVTLENQKRPNLTIYKTDADTGVPVPNTVFRVRAADGHSINEVKTDASGKAVLENLLPGVYEVSEKSVPAPYLLDAESQLVTLFPNKDRAVYFENHKAPTIEIVKEDSITHGPLAGVRFQIWYGSSHTSTGELNDLGVFTTDTAGRIQLTGPANGLREGWFRVKELAPPKGYSIKDNDTQEAFVQAGKSHTFRFENTPLSALIVYKYDSKTGEALEGAVFQVKYLGGSASGTGGTVIGTYKTGPGGSFTVTGLQAGTYIVSEVASDKDHVIDTAPQTAYISGKDQDVVQLYFGNSPKGALLVKKVDAANRTPLSDVEFMVTTSDGAVVGDANGRFVTDSAGTFTVSGIDPGTTLVVKETRAKNGYLLDDTPQTAQIKAGQTVTLEFRNQPLGSLVIHKYSSLDRKTPLAGVQFKVTYAPGCVVDDENGKISSNGIYYTGPDGTITINGIVGTVTITEQATIPGYTIDPETRSQTIVVDPDDVQHTYFYNSPKNTLIVEKYLETESGNEPLKGVTFLVTDSSGAVIGNSNGEFITGDDGQVVIAGVEPGTTVNVREIKAPEGVVLDSIPKSIKISDDGANILRFYNKKTGYLVVRKLDSITKQPLAGVEFELTYADGSYVDDAFGHLSSKGRFVTNDAGEIRVPVVGTIVVKEVKTLPTHVIDQATQIQTVKVDPADTQTITVYNEPLCSLTLRKVDAITGNPVPNTEFTLKDGNGTVLGRYTTGADGTVTVTGLMPNSTVVVVETKVPANYVLDPTPRTIIVRNGSNSVASGGAGNGGNGSGGNTGIAGGGNDLTVENMPKTTLTIEKYLETDAGNVPLKGVTFLVTDSSGAILGPNNGEYTTDENGRIVLPNLEPGMVITAKELRVPDGVVLDPTPKSIEIKGGMGGQTLTFVNKSTGGLELIKVNEADKSQRIPNVTFEIRKMDGALVDTITTDKQGRAYLDLDAGDYYAVETEAGKGFKLDATPTYFTIRDGKTTTLTVTNRAMSSILIHKIDSATKEGIYGASFLLYDANKNPIGQYSSDDRGYVYIDDLPSSGRYYLRELENEGYLVDTQLKTVYVTDGTTTEITWENTAVTGQIQITKTSEDYNSMNGWPAGTPIPNTEFEIYHYRTGKLVDTVRTDKNGVAVSKPLPLGRYKVVESKAAEFYGLDKTPIEVEIEHAGQIVKTAMTNKSLYTNVSIKKTGYAEVMPGQQIRYDLSGIANNSTTALTSFYWRDTLPVQAVRLDTIITGTYNVQGNYKIVFKTNLNGEYRTMYDNLSTMQNHVLDASPAALGLASNEYVTEFMVSFGIVPGNFRQVEAPKVYCNVVSWLTGGTQFVNQADVGGVYNGQWIMATSRWVTKVYKPSTPLPRTGY